MFAKAMRGQATLPNLEVLLERTPGLYAAVRSADSRHLIQKFTTLNIPLFDRDLYFPPFSSSFTLMATFTVNINKVRRVVNADADMPLLWVLRDLLTLTGTKYGCGVGVCGACTIHEG